MGAFNKRPSPPQDGSNESTWMRALLAYIDEQVCHGILGGKKVKHPEGGYSLVVPRTTGGARTPIAIDRFVLQEVWPNTIRCHTWDGTTEGSEDVYIAKPEKLMRITSVRIDGLTMSYAYDETPDSVTRFQFRVATAINRVPENQIIIPRYLTKEVTGQLRGDEIWALELEETLFNETDPDNAAVTHAVRHIDLNRNGRAWGKHYPA